MTNFKYSFDPSKVILFQVQLYCLSSVMFWIAALAYCVVTSTLFAQISLLFIIKAAFDSSFAPTFRAFKFFIHAFILHCVSNFSNASKNL